MSQLLLVIMLLVSSTAMASSDNWFRVAAETVWGRPSHDNLYVGMWSYHFEDSGDTDYQWQNNLIGVTYKGFYVGTFVNSFDIRSWSGGIQRDVFRTKWSDIELTTGYRAGVLTGYEKRDLANSGFGPLFQWLVDVSYKRVGAQFSYTGYVLTGGFFVRWE